MFRRLCNFFNRRRSVWICTEQWCDDTLIVCVLESKESAEAWLATMPERTEHKAYYIEEYEVRKDGI